MQFCPFCQPEITKIFYFRHSQATSENFWTLLTMRQNQLGRRNITDEQRTYLIGEAYRAQKMTVGNHAEKVRNETGQFAVCPQNEDIRKANRTKQLLRNDSMSAGRPLNAQASSLRALTPQKAYPRVLRRLSSPELSRPPKWCFAKRQ